MVKRDRRSIKLMVVGVWLAFSVSLASWWIIFGLRQLDRIASLGTQAAELGGFQKMLMWEGGVLILLLIGGGCALAYYVYQENKRFRQVNEFFATFSHELKTSIASMRLQAESLQEDFALSKDQKFDQHHANLLDRLLKDSVRLELQLENSLFLANIADQQLFVERLPLSRVVESLRPQWPQIKLDLKSDANIKADRRAVESVLKNLIQNSAIHGRAKQIVIESTPGNGNINVVLNDDGVGFAGKVNGLGRLFGRHNSTSGSGVGLYLSKQLMKKMGGNMSFKKSPMGFRTELTFQRSEA